MKTTFLWLSMVAFVCGLIDVVAMLLVRPLSVAAAPGLFLPGALLGSGLVALFVVLRALDPRNRAFLVLTGALGLAFGYFCTTGPSISESVWRWPLVVLSGVSPVAGMWLVSRAPRRTALVLTLAGAVMALAMDRWVLPRLYPAFHVALILAAFMLCAEALFRSEREALQTRAAKAWLAGYGGIGALAGVLAAAYFALPGMPVAAKAFAFGRADLHDGVPVSERNVTRKPSVWDWRNRDIVLFTIDAVRADMLESDIMPRLSARAKRGANFVQATTPTPNSSYALASLHTGTWVHAAALMHLPLPTKTLAGELHKLGYRSRAVYGASIFSVDGNILSEYARTNFGFEQRTAETSSMREICQQLKAELAASPRPLLFWSHLMEPHQPYEPQVARFGDRPFERYQAELFELDAELDACLSGLLAHPRRPLVIVTSDHGEAFGEHRSYYHGSTLYEEQLHVPLLLLGQDVSAAVNATPVSLADIAPTVLLAVGAAVPQSMFGRDLSRAAQLPQERFMAVLNDTFVVRRGSDKAICYGPSGRCDLFSLDRDPAEEAPRAVRTPWAQARVVETLGWLRAQAGLNEKSPPAVQGFGCADPARASAAARDTQAALFLRIRALQAFSACPEEGEVVAIALLDDGYMRVEAAQFLGAYGTSRSIEVLRDHLERETFLAGKQALRDAIEQLEKKP